MTTLIHGDCLKKMKPKKENHDNTLEKDLHELDKALLELKQEIKKEIEKIFAFINHYILNCTKTN